ncbi:lipase member K-like [Anoplophora glabripennis]|uniref:lipase member K-like n=1 Tax=Anoplophora glabripennis TaxID=217634 RepID=UPI000874A358|nr:lipase member K-like [Anoplophora glabripennis]
MKTFSVSLVIFCVFCTVLGQENNVCPTFKDYYTIKNNSNCWYDLAAEYNVPETIKRHGYPVLEYKVQTPDGYILTMFRIPRDDTKNPKAKYHPVYLQHGLVATCANFVGLGKNSLAFVLADAGYDVWLGNYRGNSYSQEHVNLTVYDEAYWDHSMDEVALLDLPSTFRTILKHTGHDSKIIFIGHSLGTSIALMYGAEFPEEARNIIHLFVLMSPAYTLSNMISPYRLAAPYGDFILDTVRNLKMERLVSHAQELRRMVVPMCTESPPMMQFCMQLYNLFYGPNTDLGPESIPVYFNQLPGGTSIKILNHAADLVLGNFRKYNYKHLNLKHYGRLTPPIYDIKNIHVPVYLMFSAQDWATPEADARNLWRNLPSESRYGMRKINIDTFNHIDFVFGRHARQLVYDPLVEVLDKSIGN